MGARIGLVGLLVASLAATLPASASEDTTSLWVWHHPSAVDPALVAAEGFDQVYLWAPTGFATDPAFEAFVTDATQRGVAVLAVGGDPAWSDDPEAWKQWAREVDRSDLFAGAVLDVEPYLHDAWNTDRESLLREYFRGMRRAARQLDVPMWVAVPFWFDEIGYRNSNALDHVLRRADGIVVLAYRDHAQGVDGILDVSTEEITAGETRRKPVVIGVETGPVAPEKVTFHEEGRAAMEAELAVVRDELGGSASFSGIAIHHWGSFATMAP